MKVRDKVWIGGAVSLYFLVGALWLIGNDSSPVSQANSEGSTPSERHAERPRTPSPIFDQRVSTEQARQLSSLENMWGSCDGEPRDYGQLCRFGKDREAVVLRSGRVARLEIAPLRGIRFNIFGPDDIGFRCQSKTLSNQFAQRWEGCGDTAEIAALSDGQNVDYVLIKFEEF